MTTLSNPSPIPAPDHAERDELGRLIAVGWQGATDARSSDRGRWLVAVDGSEGSLRAVVMAARLIEADPRAGIDLAHVQPWLVKEAAEVELPRWLREQSVSVTAHRHGRIDRVTVAR